MLVRNWMSTHLVSVEPDASMSWARRLMDENGIRCLPVIDQQKGLLGVVTDRDLKRASASDATCLEVHELAYLLSHIKVQDIMTPDPLTVHQHDSIEDAALIMLENKISSLPVVDNKGTVVAMLTESDVLRALVLVTGVTRGGTIFALNLADQPGSIKQAADIVRKYGARVLSILSSQERVAENRRKVYLRVSNLEPSQIKEAAKDLPQVGNVMYVQGVGPEGRQLIEGPWMEYFPVREAAVPTRSLETAA